MSRDRFPTETLRSRMLYAEDVGGPGQAPTSVTLGKVVQAKGKIAGNQVRGCSEKDGWWHTAQKPCAIAKLKSSSYCVIMESVVRQANQRMP